MCCRQIPKVICRGALSALGKSRPGGPHAIPSGRISSPKFSNPTKQARLISQIWEPPPASDGGGRPPVTLREAHQGTGRPRRGHPPRRAQPARPRPAARGHQVQRVRLGPPGELRAALRQALDHRDLRMHLLDSGRTGLFCPCVLFGRNVEALREDIPWTTPCVCHAVFVEGGIALAILMAIFHGVDPRTSFLIGEGLVFSWWLCGTYTGIFRQELQKRYHLKVKT